MSDSTLDLIETKAGARALGLVQERRRLQGMFNAQAKLDREAYYNRLADAAQEGIYQNNLRPAFRAIKSLSGRGGPSVPAPVKKEILHRWQEHFQSVLNFPPATACPELAAAASRATPDVSVGTDPMSVAKVRNAISRLKSGRVAGLDGITPELSRVRSNQSPRAYIVCFTGYGCLVVFQRIGEMRSSAYYIMAKAPKLIAPATDRYRSFPSLGRSFHMCCSGAGASSRSCLLFAVLCSLASHPAGQPLMQS